MADIKKIVPVLLNIITAQIILDILKDNKINMIRLKLKLTLGGGGVHWRTRVVQCWGWGHLGATRKIIIMILF